MSYSGVAKYAPLGSISEATFNIQPRLDARRTASMIQGSSLVGVAVSGWLKRSARGVPG